MGTVPVTEEKLGYVVYPDRVIIDLVRWGQVSEVDGISLNHLEKVLNQNRGRQPRVQHYRLREQLDRLADEGVLEAVIFHSKRKIFGRDEWKLYGLVDWGGWWSAEAIGVVVEPKREGEFAWISDPKVRARAERDPEFAATIRAEHGD